MRTRIFLSVSFLLLLTTTAFGAQQRQALDEELRRIFELKEYEPKLFGPTAWLEAGRRYTTAESNEIVAYNSSSGGREVLISTAGLTPPGATVPLEIDGYSWSRDGSRLLVFTNSKKVWRDHTRGDYWVLEVATKKLRRLGGRAEPSTLMFAKFSPDGGRVAYVRENNLYVEDLSSNVITQLTTDGSNTTINGTSDWVYEEELSLRDCFRWSPNGQSIAYWQFDTAGVETMTLTNDTDSPYPKIVQYAYPKVGTTNSAVRIGVVGVSGGRTKWMNIPGDPRNMYLARMDWLDGSDKLVIQRLNRLQNINDVLLADSKTGIVTALHRDESKTWVNVQDSPEWLNANEFVRTSEKDGWQHVFRVSADGRDERLITRFEGDVLEIAGVDKPGGWLYFIASPENAGQRYLYRSKLDGTGNVERVTPANQPGWHSYDISPDRRWAFHTYSQFDVPPTTELISLPDHRSVRVFVDNAALRTKIRSIVKTPVEFFTVGIGGGVFLDGYMVKPSNFDPTRKYPLFIYIYGEVAAQTVVDRWGGDRALFHRALANEGYIVASIDNRGTPAPKGAAWRKIVYGSLGELSSQDHAAAVRAMLSKFAFIDASRVGIWGWSGGGTNTLNAMFRFPEVYKVGIAVAPMPDQRLYDTIYEERYMGLPDANADGYRRGSAINFAEGLKGNLLIVHGSGDDNVHYQGTERLVNRLIELGKPFDLMVYPNRTHAISEGKGTTLHLYSLITRYILEHL